MRVASIRRSTAVLWRRSMLVAAAALLVLTGVGGLVLARERHREVSVITRIQRLGGEYAVEPIALKRLSKALPDRLLASVSRVIRVDLAGVQVAPADIAALRKLGWLASLDLWHASVTDSCVGELHGLNRLRHLDLSETAVTDADLPGIVRGLQGLRSLDLSGTRVDDEGLEHLRGLSELERLYIGGTNVTAAAVGDLNRGQPRLSVVH